MKTKEFVLGLLVIIGLAMSGCGEQSDGSGSASISIKSQALSTADIDHVTVTVSGPNITPNIVATLSGDPGSGWSGLIEDIPAGDNRTFLAEAFDSGDVLLYSGSAPTVTITDGGTAVVLIFLQQVDPPDPFENSVPRFTSLVLSADQVGPNNDVSLAATATDPDGDSLVYGWTAAGGSFDDDTSSSPTWTAPGAEGEYQLTVSATDPEDASATISFDIDVKIHYGRGAADVTLDINSWPEVGGLVPNPTRIEVDGSTTLDLTATDPDGDTLSFAWTADCTGSFDNAAIEDPTFTLDADNGGADCTLTVTIEDGRDGSNTASIAVATGPDVDPSLGFDFVLNAADGEANDNLGWMVSIDGDTAIVGAWLEDPSSLNDAGAAYVFVRDGSGWTQQAKLTASDAAAGDVFGYSVAISGDTAVIGAEREAPGGLSNAGAAYVFVRSGTTWTQQAKLVAGDSGAGDHFGMNVAISGDTALVGACWEDPGGLGNAGASYVFVRSGTTWSQQAKLTASDGMAGDLYGAMNTISGDTAVIGTEQGDAGGTTNCGSAYVYVRSGTTWTEQAKLTASDATSGDRFGVTGSVDGDTAVLGAWFEDPSGASNAGSAYVFVRSGTTWTQQAKLVASDAAAGDGFGFPVSLSGEKVIIGANLEDPGGVTDAGSAYVFARSGTTWTQQEKLTSDNPQPSDYFGRWVSLSGDKALVGAYQADPGGVTNAGSAFVFEGI